MKRLLCPIALILLICLLGALFVSCAGKEEQNPLSEEEIVVDPTPQDPDLEPSAEEQETLMLFLGDSIGEAVAGPAPVTEREAYGYYGIIGNTNGFTYYNRAVSGYTSADLARYVLREDDGINMVNSLITCADVIHISILGNDFFNSSMLLELADDNYDNVVRRQRSSTRNLESIFATIREKNPDAVIILQTVYNPTGSDGLLLTQSVRNELAKKGVEPKEYHSLMDKMITAINEVLYEYLEEHTLTNDAGETVRPFELIDVYSLFEEVYQTDYARWSRLFCEDGIHPTNEGHAIIAGALQAKLEELGFASAHALKRYKHLRTEQLNRLFAESLDVKAGEARIQAATTMEEVSNAYFDLIKEVAPHYTTLPTPSGKTFDQAMNFSVDSLSVLGKDEILGFLDLSLSYVYFGTDGEFEIYLEVQSSIVALLRSFIEESSGGFDLAAVAPYDLGLPFFPNIAPGVDPTDLKEILKTVERLYGISLVGLDYDGPVLQSVFRRFAERGELIFDDPDVIGDYLAFRLAGKYRIEEVTSPLTGEKCTAIYLNNGIGKNESFLRFTYDAKAEERQLRMLIDVIELRTELTQLQ